MHHVRGLGLLAVIAAAMIFMANTLITSLG